MHLSVPVLQSGTSPTRQDFELGGQFPVQIPMTPFALKVAGGNCSTANRNPWSGTSLIRTIAT
jgi:hypothetical protein